METDQDKISAVPSRSKWHRALTATAQGRCMGFLVYICHSQMLSSAAQPFAEAEVPAFSYI